jgi:hypothetical protein
LDKLCATSKQTPENVAPQLEEWKKEAVVLLDGFKVDAWLQWAPKWLVPSLFEDAPVEGNSGAVEKMTHETRVALIEQEYDDEMAKVMESMDKGTLTAEEAMEMSEKLEAKKEVDLEEARKLVDRDGGNGEDIDEDVEVIEVVEGKGKGKEKEEKKKGKAVSRKASKARIEDTDEEAEEEEEKEEKTEVAPEGWWPEEGTQVRLLIFSSFFVTDFC